MHDYNFSANFCWPYFKFLDTSKADGTSQHPFINTQLVSKQYFAPMPGQTLTLSELQGKLDQIALKSGGWEHLNPDFNALNLYN